MAITGRQLRNVTAGPADQRLPAAGSDLCGPRRGGAVARLPGPSPGARELVEGGRIGQLLAVAARGVHQRGSCREALLGVMSKKHLDSLQRSPLLSLVYTAFANDSQCERR